MVLERTDGFRALLLRRATSFGRILVRMDNRPWQTLSEQVTGPLRPRLPTLVREVVDAVQSAVPEYASLDPAVSRGVHVGLEGFLDLVDGRDATLLPGRDVYVRFGRAEARNGRSLDALLTAYRAGARVAWRGFAAGGDSGGGAARGVFTPAQGGFAYLREISAGPAARGRRREALSAPGAQERGRR